MSKTKLTLDAYTELRRRLNNECGKTCPIDMIYKKSSIVETSNNHNERFCKVCIKEFRSLFINITKPHQCPCYNKGYTKEIFLRLDELIAELTITLSKEYSS